MLFFVYRNILAGFKIHQNMRLKKAQSYDSCCRRYRLLRTNKKQLIQLMIFLFVSILYAGITDRDYLDVGGSKRTFEKRQHARTLSNGTED